MPSSADQYIWVSWPFQLSTDCQSHVNQNVNWVSAYYQDVHQGSIEMSIEGWSRVSVDTWLQMPLIYIIQTIYSVRPISSNLQSRFAKSQLVCLLAKKVKSAYKSQHNVPGQGSNLECNHSSVKRTNHETTVPLMVCLLPVGIFIYVTTSAYITARTL